jgi:hypothetical protein
MREAYALLRSGADPEKVISPEADVYVRFVLIL